MSLDQEALGWVEVKRKICGGRVSKAYVPS
jgi:hypothetical protein